MPFWQRLLITVIAMLTASFVAGLIWQGIFNIGLPSYAAGIIGGLTALFAATIALCQYDIKRIYAYERYVRCKTDSIHRSDHHTQCGKRSGPLIDHDEGKVCNSELLLLKKIAKGDDK